MSLIRVLLLSVIGSLLAVQVAFGAGGVDGGGGGGNLVPNLEQAGPNLSKVFSEGVAFLAERDCKRAEKKFRAVLKEVPRNSEANYLCGISLQCQRDHKAAIRYFRRAKRDDFQFYQAFEALGISYLSLERPDLAQNELNELDWFKRICQIGNRICPGKLLKSHRKLLTAIRRVEGRLVESEEYE